MRFALALIVAVFLAGCGGRDGTSNKNGDGEDAGFPLRIIGLNERFDPTEVEAPAGVITISFDNQDEGILHNIRFYEGSNADGRFVRKSELERGPEVQILSMDLQPGSYFYDCEVHPASMTGTLLVR